MRPVSSDPNSLSPKSIIISSFSSDTDLVWCGPEKTAPFRLCDGCVPHSCLISDCIGLVKDKKAGNRTTLDKQSIYPYPGLWLFSLIR